MKSISRIGIHQGISRIIPLLIPIPSPCTLFSTVHYEFVVDRLQLGRYELPRHIMQNGIEPVSRQIYAIPTKLCWWSTMLVSRWTVSSAADVIGIRGEWRERIAAATHPNDVRQLYSQLECKLSTLSIRRGLRGAEEAAVIVRILCNVVALVLSFNCSVIHCDCSFTIHEDILPLRSITTSPIFLASFPTYG